MKNTLTELPEKWAVKITHKNREVLRKWVESRPDFNINFKKNSSHMGIGYYVASKHESDDSYQLWTYNEDLTAFPHTEITFEQFKKYVLKQEEQPVMEKKLKGYILKNREMYKAASMIAFGNTAGSQTWDDNEPDDRKDILKKLQKAGILDLWFEPVYEEVKPKFKVDDWITFDGDFVKGGPYKLKAVHKNGEGGYDENGEFKDLINPGYRLATDEEIENHLIKEAKKRGIVPGVTLAKTGINAKFSFIFNPIKGYRYYRQDDVLDSMGGDGSGQGQVYKNGKWAEIEEAPKIVIKGYDADIESGQVKFGCQTYSNEFIRTLVKCLETNNLNMDYRDEIIKLSKHLKD